MKFKNAKQVWKAIDAGKTVYWVHEGYKVFVEDYTPGNEKYTDTKRGNKVLSVRCIENYFGSVLQKSEYSKLFTKRNARSK